MMSVLYNNIAYFTLFSDVAVWSEDYGCYFECQTADFPLMGMWYKLFSLGRGISVLQTGCCRNFGNNIRIVKRYFSGGTLNLWRMDIILPCEFLNGVWETGFHSRARDGCHVSTLFGSGRDNFSVKCLTDFKSVKHFTKKKKFLFFFS